MTRSSWDPFGSTGAVALAALTALTTCASCASTPSPDAKLAEAVAVIAQLKASGHCTDRSLREAEDALEYARFEARRDGEDGLATQHAKVALEKALSAEAACREVAARR